MRKRDELKLAAKRRAKMRRMRNAGMTLAEIGIKFPYQGKAITPQRVSQLLGAEAEKDSKEP